MNVKELYGFEIAVKRLKSGEGIRRSSWPKNQYVELQKDETSINIFYLNRYDGLEKICTMYDLCMGDIMANDWEDYSNALRNRLIRKGDIDKKDYKNEL